MKNNQKLSVAIATYNEADAIERCLNSIVSIANEIIIYDANSDDDTIKKIKKYKNVILISGPNHPVFHLNKQAAIDKCTGDWVLQLDADEEVTPELSREIITLINSDPPDNGFWVNRQNFFLGHFLKKGGIYPDPTIRLYRRNMGKLPCKDVHEQAEIIGTVGHLQQDLLHYSDPTFSRYLLRHDRYTSLLATQLFHKDTATSFLGFLSYFLIKPIHWFVLAYFLHKGFYDGFPGFVFAYFSAIRFPAAYVKLWEMKHAKKI